MSEQSKTEQDVVAALAEEIARSMDYSPNVAHDHGDMMTMTGASYWRVVQAAGVLRRTGRIALSDGYYRLTDKESDALTAACDTYAADPTDANWTTMLVADDAARLAAGVEAAS
jgi:hypothetical protein